MSSSSSLGSEVSSPDAKGQRGAGGRGRLGAGCNASGHGCPSRSSQHHPNWNLRAEGGRSWSLVRPLRAAPVFRGGAIAAGRETPFSSDPERARRNQVLEPVTGNMSIAGVVGRAWLVTALTPPQGAAGELESTSTGDFDPYCCFAASLPGSDVGHRDAPFLSSGPGSPPQSGGAGHFPVRPNLEPSQ